MRFSQRRGKVPATKKIQLESMDDELRNSLWNVITTSYLDKIISNDLHKCLWRDFYKEPIDQVPPTQEKTIHCIREAYFGSAWYEIYDFIEFMLNINFDKERVEVSAWCEFSMDNFANELNKVLERESSAYRIKNLQLVPISDDAEFREVMEAIDGTEGLTALTGANIHLDKALDFLSDRRSPNYRNSIKESISAVEAICRVITSEHTFRKAINKLEEKGLNVNAQFKEGIIKFYAYTNDKESGIRHAIVEQPNEPDYYDAKYMLVLCSSFINYLIGKADIARIAIE